MAENVVATSDSSFDLDVLQSDLPVLVDFWAPWCGPCKMISPILDELAEEQAARIKIVKVNVDECKEISVKYAVRGIPSLLLFKQGNLLGSVVGALSKSQLQEFLDEHL